MFLIGILSCLRWSVECVVHVHVRLIFFCNNCVSVLELASYPGRGGEVKRPGTFCMRMRRVPQQNSSAAWVRGYFGTRLLVAVCLHPRTGQQQ